MLYVSPAKTCGGAPAGLYANPRSFADAVHPDDQAVTADYWARRRAARRSLRQYRIVRPDGSIGWIWDRAFPVRDDTGRVVRIVGVAENVTSRKQAEEELRRALAQNRNSAKPSRVSSR
ncbi:MAG: PAS domain-containing protein [Anaerolineae bacterium]